MTLRIVAAAVRVQLSLPSPDLRPSGPMTFSKPPPARHSDLVFEVADLIGRPVEPREQGFLASDGTFLGRLSARSVARLAGQVPLDDARADLFSEDLW